MNRVFGYPFDGYAVFVQEQDTDVEEVGGILV